MTLADVAAADRFVDLAGLLESCEVDGFHADFLSWGHYRPEYWRNYWHSHSFHEVCLAYSGEGRFNSGSVAVRRQPGLGVHRPTRATSTRSSRAAMHPSASPSGVSRSVPGTGRTWMVVGADPSGRTRHIGADSAHFPP